MGLLFTATSILCIVAAIPVVRSQIIKSQDRHHLRKGPLPKISIDAAIIGALCIAVAFGLLIGVYESTWTLLMDTRHATELQIALTWTVFSLPYIFLVRVGGWLSGRFDRRIMAIGGLAIGLLFLALWPHISSIMVIIALCPVEPFGSSMMLPSVQGLLTQNRTPSELGRIQGLYATANTAAIAVSASVSGWLFQIGHSLPYSIGAGLGAGLLVAAGISWRSAPGYAGASTMDQL
jgi:MFS family permease